MDIAVTDSERRHARGMPGWLIAGMRYVLLRPALKRPAMRLLSCFPGVLMTAKRFGVRAGLAQDMGDNALSAQGQRSKLQGPRGLSVRAGRLHDALRSAMSGQQG